MFVSFVIFSFFSADDRKKGRKKETHEKRDPCRSSFHASLGLTFTPRVQGVSEMPSISAFIRKLIIYGYVYDVNYDDIIQYNKELNAIGNNVNQIVRLCQKTGNVYAEDISEIKELLEKIWHIQESILSRQP